MKLLYGCGLRISEAVQLWVQDIDYGYKQVTVRNGKGNKDRVTPFPGTSGFADDNDLYPCIETGWGKCGQSPGGFVMGQETWRQAGG